MFIHGLHGKASSSYSSATSLALSSMEVEMFHPVWERTASLPRREAQGEEAVLFSGPTMLQSCCCVFSSAMGMFGVGGWMRGRWGGGEEPEDGRRTGEYLCPQRP